MTFFKYIFKDILICVTSLCVLLNHYSENTTNVGTEMVFSDFDGATITFSYPVEQEFVVKLDWVCIKVLLENGSKEVLEKVYEKYELATSDAQIIVKVSKDKIPEDDAGKGVFLFSSISALFFFIASLIDLLSSIKRHVFSGPFLRIMDGDKTKTKDIPTFQLEIKPQEFIWIIPTSMGGFTCAFSNRVSDATDLPIVGLEHMDSGNMFLQRWDSNVENIIIYNYIF